jgi:hypothetical protein
MASENQDMAVAKIVSAIVAKGFDKDTDGCDLRFEGGTVQLVDANGQTMSLQALVEIVKRSLA